MDSYQPFAVLENLADAVNNNQISQDKCQIQMSVMFPQMMGMEDEVCCDYGGAEPTGRQRYQANARERDRTQRLVHLFA